MYVMCKSVNIFVFWSYQCCVGALKKHYVLNVHAFFKLCNRVVAPNKSSLLFCKGFREIKQPALSEK